MNLTICDRCPRESMTLAEFRAEFYRLKQPAGEVAADKPVDLCRMHYDALWPAP